MRFVNPVVVFVWLVLIIFLSLIFDSILPLFLLFLTSFVPYFLFPSQIWKVYMKYSLITSFFIVIFDLFLVQGGRVLFAFYFIQITSDSIVFSLSMVLRFLSIVSSFGIFSSMVTTEQQIRILEKLKIPQKTIISLIISLRFFPVVFNDSKNMMDALKARGIEFKGKKIRDRIKERLPLLTSLLMISLERSINIAESLELKGFPSDKRTPWSDENLRLRDRIIVVTFIFDIFLSIFYLISNIGGMDIISTLIPILIVFGRCKYAEH